MAGRIRYEIDKGDGRFGRQIVSWDRATEGDKVVQGRRQRSDHGRTFDIFHFAGEKKAYIRLAIRDKFRTALDGRSCNELGRDLFTRIWWGARISLFVGVAAAIIDMFIGVFYGAFAGMVGGKIEEFMMRLSYILYSLPHLLIVILLMVVFGRHIVLIFVAIGAVNWLDMARIVRGQTLSLKNTEFVEAARACGVDHHAIIRRHIIPNLIGVVIVYVTLTIPQVILVESFLSFLGLGVQEPMSSWGALVNDGAQDMESAPWTLVFPAAFLTVTLYCFNYIGDGMRDALDPKDRF